MTTDNITDKNILKSWFKRGLKPLESQFHAWIDSYWHKNEKIPTSSIRGLEDTLNKKAETTALEDIDKGLKEHSQDLVLHKTEGEQGKLDNLADNPDATYLSKEEFKSAKPILFTATYTNVDNVKRYTLDSGQVSKFTDYFEKEMTNPVILYCLGENNLVYEVYCLENVNRKKTLYTMNFTGINPGIVTRFMLKCMRLGSSGWSQNLFLAVNTYPFSEPEYKYDRYVTNGPYDMDEMIISGGISGIVDGDIIGTNVPDGFTDFYGYVLNCVGDAKNSMCCTQVITDKVLRKTMIRSSVPDDDPKNIVWLPWKEIGGSTESSVFVVNEYPTDLSSYPDGSIFIKQQAS